MQVFASADPHIQIGTKPLDSFQDSNVVEKI